ncbi:MAG: hypothetical protein ABEJ68_01445 [Halobacteriaceae archaeon]
MARPEYGETWVYESIVGALPGVDLSPRAAVLVQFVLFEGAVLALAAAYGRWDAVVPGTAAVLVATAGSAFMLTVAGRLRTVSLPDQYVRTLFGSSVEVVLGLLAYVALLTYLFVVDPRAAPVLLPSLLGDPLPVPAVYLALLVCWDLCYRIGTAWWAAVVAAWRSFSLDFDADAAASLRAADRDTALFAALQLLLLPAVLDHPLLAVALVGHVCATFGAVGLSLWGLRS